MSSTILSINHRVIWFNLIIGISTKLSRDLYIPAFIVMAAFFHATITDIQLSISFYFFGMLFSRFFFAPCSDLLGRRKLLLMGLAIFVLGSLCCLLSFNIWHLHLGRCFQGIGIGCLPPISRAMLHDVFDTTHTHKLLAKLSIIIAWAPAGALLLGGILIELFVWQVHFFTLFVIGLCIFFWAYLLLPETHTVGPVIRQPLHRFILQYKLTLSSSNIRFNIISGCLVLAGICLFLVASSPIVLQQFNVSPTYYGALYFILILLSILGSLVSSYLISFYKAFYIITIASVCCFISSLLLNLIIWTQHLNLLLFYASISLFFFGAGMIEPTCRSAVMKGMSNVSATASGLLGVTQALFSGVSVTIFALLSYISLDLRLAMGLLIISILSVLNCFFYFIKGGQS